MTDDLLSARTRRRLARSPYAPIPRGDDPDVAQLRDDVLARLLVERLNSLGYLPIGNSAAECTAQMRSMIALWRDVIKKTNIRIE